MTQVTPEILKKLSEKFSYKALSWRAGDSPVTREDGLYAAALPYLDARDVQNRLDDVVGPENWKSEFTISPQGHIICRLSIFINGNWISKEDGSAIEQGSRAREFNAKAGFSDALKRAAVAWGIGRYLYAYRAELVKLASDNHSLSYIPALPAEFLLESEQGEAQTREITPRINPPARTAEAEKTVAPVATTSAPATPAPAAQVAPAKAAEVPAKPVVADVPADIPAAQPVNTPAAKAALEAALGETTTATVDAGAVSVEAIVAGMDAAQNKVFDNITHRINTGLAASMLRGFITAGSTNLTQDARNHLLRLLDEREAKKA